MSALGENAGRMGLGFGADWGKHGMCPVCSAKTGGWAMICAPDKGLGEPKKII